MGAADFFLDKLARLAGFFFGSANERALRKYWPVVARVNEAWAAIRGLDDTALRAKTVEFRRRLLAGATEEDLLPEAFACCREAAHRTLGGGQMTPVRYRQLAVRGDRYTYEQVDGPIPLFAHFDVQLLGGVAMHRGQIAEMVTGEGKTLVATLPAYLNALRPNDRWQELARQLQGEDPARWRFLPYGLYAPRPPAPAPATATEPGPDGAAPDGDGASPDGDGAPAGGDGAPAPAPAPPPPPAAPEWRLMPKLRPDPANPEEMATWETPLEIVGVSRGVHIITVNDYLAQRDADYNAPLFGMLGMDVGAIQSGMDPHERYPVYRGEVVYGTNSEFGFDYLRDNLKVRRRDQVQAGRFFAIVDEVDSVLVDEARTPLIISGSTRQSADRYQKADQVARALTGGERNAVEEKIALAMGGGLQREDARLKAEEDWDYVYSERDHSAKLTERGMHRVLRLLDMDNLYAQENLDLPHYIDNALRAHALYHRDHHYIVRDGQVYIVDEFTGRVLEGRRWSDGLHQAVEAKERLRVKEESQTVATITYQNFFRLYGRLAGMTGTAMTEAKEFDRIYRLGVLAIPTNRPLLRRHYPDLIYGTLKEKYQALADHVEEVYATGQPMLIGTVSIERSEHISALLKGRGIEHQVLNAKNHAREAGIVAAAGQFAAVTVATNMAGRGTDIKLGPVDRGALLAHWRRRGLAPRGHDLDPSWDDGRLMAELLPVWVDHYLPEAAAKEPYESRKPEEWKALLEAHWAAWGLAGPRLADRVSDLGGLHIVGTERHEARRIDNQLSGRSGRQGDPGSSRFFLSLEDDMMRMFASEKVKRIMQWSGLKDGMPIESRLVSRAVENAQRKVEERNFETRKNLIEYDQVMNDQRAVVYGRRQEWVEDRLLRESMLEYCGDRIDGQVRQELARPAEEWDPGALAGFMREAFGVEADPARIGELRLAPDPEARTGDWLLGRLEEAYAAKEEALGPELMRILEKMILIEKLDAKWMDHLSSMDLLKEGIHLRSFAGQDPKIRYKIEGFQMFQEMWDNTRRDAADLVMKVTLAQPREAREGARAMVARQADFDARADRANRVGADAGEAARRRPIVNQAPKVSPNAPCPCGSGKKYKKCHGK